MEESELQLRIPRSYGASHGLSLRINKRICKESFIAVVSLHDFFDL